jgi:tRNA (guanine-N7-)-methyltransferase
MDKDRNKGGIPGADRILPDPRHPSGTMTPRPAHRPAPMSDSSDLPHNNPDAEVAPPSAPADGGARRRSIRSFVVRAGRMGTGQIRALEELGPRFVLPFAAQPLDTAAAFGRDAPVILEIGFGMGAATAQIAQSRPDTNFLGVEVHVPGVGALLKLIDEKALNNIRILQHDAVEVLEQMIPPGSLAGVHVYFPDPWHKKKHNKRRLIQPPLVALLASRLAPGGVLHCATDWQPYAEQMLEVLGAEPLLVNTAEAYAPRPDYRPLTKFENRGLKLGHGVWDLVFTRR